MTADSTRGSPPSEPYRRREPKWEFKEVTIETVELRRQVNVPVGGRSVSVSRAVEVRLIGSLDPGAFEWSDSYLPTIRIGSHESSRMTTEPEGVRFTFYPDVDGELEDGPVEFRARLGREFEETGLRVGGGREGPRQAPS